MEEMFHALVDTYVLMGGPPLTKRIVDNDNKTEDSESDRSATNLNKVKNLRPSVNLQAKSGETSQKMQLGNTALIIIVLVILICMAALLTFVVFQRW